MLPLIKIPYHQSDNQIDKLIILKKNFLMPNIAKYERRTYYIAHMIRIYEFNSERIIPVYNNLYYAVMTGTLSIILNRSNICLS